MKAIKRYIYNVVIGFNQFVNSLFCGSPDETICARAWLNRHRQPYKSYIRFLDALFYPFQGPGHCEGAYRKERERKHYSREALNDTAAK